jgi:uncharacterized protein
MAPAYRIPIAELRRRLGQRRRVEVDHDPGPLAVGTSHTAGDPVSGVLVIESIAGGVSVSGDLRTTWRSECRRCLEAVEGETTIDVHEIYLVHAPPDSDIYELFSEDQVDLAPMIRESVLLSLPLGPLCDVACKGPDPERFPAATAATDEGPSDEGEPAPDPRWSALGEVRFDEG